MTSLTLTPPLATQGTELIHQAIAVIAEQLKSIDKQLKDTRTKMDAAADVDPTPSSIDLKEQWSLAMIKLKKERCTLGSQLMVDIQGLTAVAREYGFGRSDAGVSMFD